jgi:hypothetical protein
MDNCVGRSHGAMATLTKRLGLLLILILTSTVSGPATVQALAQTAPQQDAEASLSRTFRCPETYSSDGAKKSAVRDFVQSYSAHFPTNNTRDLMLFRYHLLVAHSCIQTLNFMLTNVGPLDEMLRFQNDDLGPRTEEYDHVTRVWTVWFRKDGEPGGLSEEDLILNFYGWPGPTPDAIATAFARTRPDFRVIFGYGAPDDLTGAKAFFVVSQQFYPGETYGYVNISKISSVGSGTYTATLAEKIHGSSAEDIERKSKAWLNTAAGKATITALDKVGVDRLWEQYLAEKLK